MRPEACFDNTCTIKLWRHFYVSLNVKNSIFLYNFQLILLRITGIPVLRYVEIKKNCPSDIDSTRFDTLFIFENFSSFWQDFCQKIFQFFSNSLGKQGNGLTVYKLSFHSRAVLRNCFYRYLFCFCGIALRSCKNPEL